MRAHPDLAPVSFLIGTWRGTGRGHYPTIQDFSYEEEVVFAPGPGKPFLVYSQRTARAGSLEPLHSETGYLRPAGPGRAELTIAQPTGVVEAYAGSLDGGHLHLRSVSVGTTPTAKEVTDVERHIEVSGEVLRYRLSMAAVGNPLQPHLEAELHRVG